MAELVTAFFCQKSITDAEKNLISAIEIIEGIEVHGPSLPDSITIPATGEIVAIWMRSDVNTPEDFSCRTYLSDPLGDHENKATVLVNLTQVNHCRSIFRLSTIEIRGEGLYRFNIEKQTDENTWETVSRIPFIVRHIHEENNQERKPI